MSEEQDIAEFWQDYENTYGEKVLAFHLGSYLRGYATMPTSMWGLLIATDAGFRFHHFAQESWLSVLSRTSSRKGAKEKTAFIPKEKIISVEYQAPKSLLKKILTASRPLFVLRYYDEEKEYEFVAETDKGGLKVVEALKNLSNP
ncbi:MAG: hypothetical protein LBV04_08810 [Deferribacteraceae bacterium]|jgi:hypothetical protein|nr:hypothetical protein [Deferribacteraceae bacterium]